VLRDGAPREIAPHATRLGAIAQLSFLHGPSGRRIHSITMPQAHRERMRIDVVGRLALRADLVASEIMPSVLRRHWGESLANVTLFPLGAEPVDAEDPVSRYVA